MLKATLSCLFLSFLSQSVAAYGTPSHSLPLKVDLGYEVYQGIYNGTTKLNYYRGIRYAAPATGKNRFQAPKSPAQNRGSVIPASQFPQRCPQGPPAPISNAPFNFTGNEDCLFLSVSAPPNAKNLPVFFWIHGGGYGAGQGNQDTSILQNTNNNGFVSVVIQYRLGAFGFLGGDEVHTFGTNNAGLLDQHFALEWVQKYVHLFGGDKSRVTIAGESAGGGSVMLQAMAYGGTEGTKYFQNGIASSPYDPQQYPYYGWQPSQAYYAFAAAAGCFDGRAYGSASQTIFECLVGADTATLQNASYRVGASGTSGTWAFLPVTDGDFVRDIPSRQVTSGKLNGKRMLTGNNANEGVAFTPQNITTEAAFEAYLRNQLPLFSDADIAATLRTYRLNPADANSPRFATDGVSPPYAVDVGSFATGQQQRANNLYSENTFVCPSYWLALGYEEGYKYQFSVPASQHGADITAEGLGPRPPNISPEFTRAFQTIWGNFIIHNNPSISSVIANGNSSAAINGASRFPRFSRAHPQMLNLNETGGEEFSIAAVGNSPNVTEYEGAGLRNNIQVVNAWTWEGGRGIRCDFWLREGPKVPEK